MMDSKYPILTPSSLLPSPAERRGTPSNWFEAYQAATTERASYIQLEVSHTCLTVQYMQFGKYQASIVACNNRIYNKTLIKINNFNMQCSVRSVHDNNNDKSRTISSMQGMV